MSRSFCSSGSTTQTRGRGTRSRPLGNVNKNSRIPTAPTNVNSTRTKPVSGRGMWNPSNNLPDRSGVAGRGINPAAESQNAKPETEKTNSEQQLSHCGAFSMLTPNEARRQKITSQAEKETQQYEAYKQKNKLKHVNYVGTVGGGEKAEAEARREAQQKQVNAKFQRLQKQQQWREEKKKQEEDANEQKKQEARRQAKLKVERERRREEKLREDMRRKNNAFLDKLESQKPAAQSQPVQSQMSSGSSKPKPQHRGAGEGGGISQSLSSRPNQPSPQSHITAERRSADFEDQLATDFGEQMYLGSSNEVGQLSAMFPNFSREFLNDIFQQTGSLDAAATLLMEMQD